MNLDILEFSPEGCSRFEGMIDRLVLDPKDPVGLALLSKAKGQGGLFELDQYATPVGQTIDWSGNMSASELADVLVSKFPYVQQSRGAFFGRIGMWNWLAYSAICNRIVWDRSKKLRKKTAYYIGAESSYKDYYRHVVRSRWFVRAIHGGHGEICLHSKLDVFSDASEQILSRHYFCESRGLVELACRMFYDDSASVFRPRNNYTSGLRDLLLDVDALAVNYDVRAMPVDALYLKLRPELQAAWKLNPPL
jgi:hypothetical protein